jgi:hypothetical protein
MSPKGLSIQQVIEDIQQANELAEDFGYGTDSDGRLIAEEYGPDGEIVATYSIGITITQKVGN